MKSLALAALLAALLCSGCQRPAPAPAPVKASAATGQPNVPAAVAPKPANTLATAPTTAATPKSGQFDLAILAWNIESGQADNDTILAQLKELGKFDIIALSEVPPASAEMWKTVLPGGVSNLGTTGDSDRLLIAFNGERFEQIRVMELAKFDKFTLNPGNQRSPLIVHLRDKATGYEFLVMNNHLARGNAEQRKTQALGISAWAREQKLPMIAVGDYNFDFDFPTKSGNEAFRAFLADGVWKWIEPKEWIDSNWADRDKDGKDDFPDSLLDMVFVAGPAKDWTVEVNVIVRPGDFPDDDKTSDHRPVKVAVKVGK